MMLDSERDYFESMCRLVGTDYMNSMLADTRRVQYWNDGTVRALYHPNPSAAKVIEQLPNLEILLLEVDHVESTFLRGKDQGVEFIPDDELTGDYRQTLINLGRHPTLKRVYIFFTEDEIYSDVSLHSIQNGEVAVYRLAGVTGSDVEYYVIDDIH